MQVYLPSATDSAPDRFFIHTYICQSLPVAQIGIWVKARVEYKKGKDGRIVDPDPVFKPDPLNSLKIELFLQYLLFRKKRIKCEFLLGKQLVYFLILVLLRVGSSPFFFLEGRIWIKSTQISATLLSGAIHEARTSKSLFLLP